MVFIVGIKNQLWDRDHVSLLFTIKILNLSKRNL